MILWVPFASTSSVENPAALDLECLNDGACWHHFEAEMSAPATPETRETPESPEPKRQRQVSPLTALLLSEGSPRPSPVVFGVGPRISPEEQERYMRLLLAVQI